jgi:hypothetical protein
MGSECSRNAEEWVPWYYFIILFGEKCCRCLNGPQVGVEISVDEGDEPTEDYRNSPATRDKFNFFFQWQEEKIENENDQGTIPTF